MKIKITVSNTTLLDKSEREWIQNLGQNKFYKAAGWSNFAFAKGLARDLFKEKLLKIPLEDHVLDKEETLQLKNILENKVKYLLSGRSLEPDQRIKIEFLGEIIGLNCTPLGKNDQDNWINKFYKAYKICEECLEENKSVYINIVKNED